MFGIVVEIGIDGVVANAPEVTFKNWARGGLVDVADAGFVLFDKIGGGGKAVIERFGRGIIFKKFVDEVFNYGFE